MKSVREALEIQEAELLSPFAARSSAAVRDFVESPCPYRTAFQRDRDRIIHSKAFRRLKHKTQVFISPKGDHYRTRLTHTLEVAQISRTIARALNLNEDLVEAVALGHDVGHTPFGHPGEFALRKIMGQYNHNEQSIRVVEILERDGKGLNLTREVRDGILNHTGPNEPYTLESKIVRIGDRIAYLTHDYDDSLRAGMLRDEEIPREITDVLGTGHSEMITTMVSDIINNSMGQNDIKMSSAVRNAMDRFREFMFEKVYHSRKLYNEREKAEGVIIRLFEYFIKYPKKLPRDYYGRIKDWGLERVVVDYIAGLTDHYAISLYSELFIPVSWKSIDVL